MKMGGKAGSLQAIEFIGVVEAAIGIEPTCKGFAVLKRLFSRVQPDTELSLFVGLDLPLS